MQKCTGILFNWGMPFLYQPFCGRASPYGLQGLRTVRHIPLDVILPTPLYFFKRKTKEQHNTVLRPVIATEVLLPEPVVR